MGSGRAPAGQLIICGNTVTMNMWRENVQRSANFGLASSSRLFAVICITTLRGMPEVSCGVGSGGNG